MDSRQRVLCALNHQEPDRVPIDMGGTIATSIDVGAYYRLRQYLGLLERPVRVYDIVQMEPFVDMDVIERLGVDCVMVPWLRPRLNMRLDTQKPWVLFDGTPVQVPQDFAPVENPDGSLDLVVNGTPIARMPKGAPHFEPIPRRSSGKLDLPDLSTMNLPLLTDEELRYCQDQARALRQGTDKALVSVVETSLGPWGAMEDWLMAMALEREYVREYNEKKTEGVILNLELYAEAVGPYLDVIGFHRDLGGQNNPLISPSTFRDLFFPCYKRTFGWVHEHTDWKVFFHCCGSIVPLIPLFIECGVDILNPVQCSAANMDPERLKREFGQDLVFWGGGVDTQTVLSFGSPEQVRRQVRERVSILGPGGGFVFTPVHAIQSEVPPENIVAAYETVLEYGRYPLTNVS